MKTTRILAIFFIVMIIFETFYPLGKCIELILGDWGLILGNILYTAGFGSLVWKVIQLKDKEED